MNANANHLKRIQVTEKKVCMLGIICHQPHYFHLYLIILHIPNACLFLNCIHKRA